jgi:hypothetical protein
VAGRKGRKGVEKLGWLGCEYKRRKKMVKRVGQKYGSGKAFGKHINVGASLGGILQSLSWELYNAGHCGTGRYTLLVTVVLGGIQCWSLWYWEVYIAGHCGTGRYTMLVTVVLGGGHCGTGRYTMLVTVVLGGGHCGTGRFIYTGRYIITLGDCGTGKVLGRGTMLVSLWY